MLRVKFTLSHVNWLGAALNNSKQDKIPKICLLITYIVIELINGRWN